MDLSKEHLMLMDCYKNENYTVKELKRILNIEEIKVRKCIRELFLVFKVRNILELREVTKRVNDWRSILKQKVSITKEDRKKYILLKFINKSTINLSDISKEIGVSRRIISTDLEELKDEIKKLKVGINSLNSKGIELVGREEDKKEAFIQNLLKIFMEKEYLSTIFDEIFQSFDEIISDKIEGFVSDIIEKKEVLKQTYLQLHFELYLYVGIIRNRSGLNSSGLHYELKRIREMCKQNRTIDLMQNYRKDHYKVDQLIDYIEKNTNLRIVRDKSMYLAVNGRLKIMEFKRMYKLKEIYPINKNFEKAYKNFFDSFIDIIENYFENKIDSMDKISLFLSFNKFMTFKKNIEEKFVGKTIVLYNFFQKQLLDLHLRDIEEKIRISIDDAISVYILKKYQKENNLKRIVLLENIDLEKFNLSNNIEIIQINFPISEMDCLKI